PSKTRGSSPGTSQTRASSSSRVRRISPTSSVPTSSQRPSPSMSATSIDRFVLGSADLRADSAPAVLERFRGAGGQKLDLANVYGDGESSRAIGSWLNSSGARDELVLFTKGCHPPYCKPTLVQPEIDVARSLLGIDTLDVFILHRDDATIPV